MANSTFLKSLPKFGHVGAAIGRRSPSCMILASKSKYIQTSSPQESSAAKDGKIQVVNETIMPGENMEDKAFSSPQQVNQKNKDVAGMVSKKENKTMEVAKETAQRVKERMLENDYEDCSKEFVKANAESVKKSMNTKGI